MDGWRDGWKSSSRQPIPEGSHLTFSSFLAGCLLLQLLITPPSFAHKRLPGLDLTWAHSAGKAAKRLQIWLGYEQQEIVGRCGNIISLGRRWTHGNYAAERVLEVNLSCTNRLELNSSWAMNHSVSLPFNYITEPATFVSATIYIDTNICIYTDRGMWATEAFWLIVSLERKRFFSSSLLLCSVKSWFKDAEMEVFKGPGGAAVGGEIQDSFGKHFQMLALGWALGSGSGVVEGMKINKTHFLPPCNSKSGGAADWQEEGQWVVKDFNSEIKQMEIQLMGMLCDLGKLFNVSEMKLSPPHLPG